MSDSDTAYYEGLWKRLSDARTRAIGSPTVEIPWDDSAGLLALLLDRTSRRTSTPEQSSEGGRPDSCLCGTYSPTTGARYTAQDCPVHSPGIVLLRAAVVYYRPVALVTGRPGSETCERFQTHDTTGKGEG